MLSKEDYTNGYYKRRKKHAIFDVDEDTEGQVAPNDILNDLGSEELKELERKQLRVRQNPNGPEARRKRGGAD
jgi:hypothetical protein